MDRTSNNGNNIVGYCCGFRLVMSENHCIFLKRDQYCVMLDHVMSLPNEEVCGLIGGRGRTADQILPITNELRSPVRYRMSPNEQIKAFVWLEENHFDLVAIYHSHPSGPGRPSETDIAEFMFPGVFSLIWYCEDQNWNLAGFLIQKHQLTSIKIVVNN